MLTDYIGIIKLVMLGLDILVALILLRFVITGLRRGFARNCFRLVLIVVLVLLFSVGFKPIIKSVINMPLPIDFDVYADEVTLVNIVETLVCDNMFEGDITALKEANISGLLTDVTVSAVSIVVFTVMSILIYILIAPIITLICKIFLPFLRKKQNGLRIRYGTLSKLLGLGCALVRFAILMMIFFVPLYGALEIGKVVVDEAAIVDEDMKELSVELDESVGSSVMLKLTSNISVGYMPQNYDDMLNDDKTPVEYLQQYLGYDKQMQSKIMTCLGALNFVEYEMKNSVKELSGGQKAKLFLLQLVLNKNNVLVLDEPTRNLSPLSNPVIRNILKSFKGTIISVSHDRKYIFDVSTRVYELSISGMKKIDIY